MPATPTRVVRAMRRGALAGARAAGSTLVARVGVIATARALAGVAARAARGEPFAGLPPPVDERERRSRAQARDVVLLDRAVTAIAGPAVALEVCRAAVLAGGTAFLAGVLPAGGALAARAAELAGWFFNATGEVAVAADGEVRFDVTHCHFAALLPRVGAAHLAPLFCAADDVYFGDPRRGIALARTGTLATGAPRCDFRFRAGVA